MVWILIWLAGWDFSREPIKIITKKIIKGPTFCCTDEYICDKDKRKDPPPTPPSCVVRAYRRRDCTES